MKMYMTGLLLSIFLLSSCGENNYDRHSESDEIPAADTGTSLETGAGTESIADPNAANTKRTPVPLDSVTVDTSK